MSANGILMVMHGQVENGHLWLADREGEGLSPDWVESIARNDACLRERQRKGKEAEGGSGQGKLTQLEACVCEMKVAREREGESRCSPCA